MHLKKKSQLLFKVNVLVYYLQYEMKKPHSAFYDVFHEDFVLYVATDRQSKR